MAYNVKAFSQFPPGTNVLATDYYLGLDVTNITPSHPTGQVNKYTINQLLEFAINNFAQSNIITAYVGTIGNLTAAYDNGPNNNGIGATLTNSGTFSALIIDGVTLTVGQRVLVSMQTTTLENGVYTVTNVGSSINAWILTRATDFDGSTLGQINQGDFIAVLFGTDNALSFWFVTSSSNPVIGTNPITFQRQSTIANDNWVTQTTSSVTMAINTGYTCAAGATMISLLLPPTAPIGSWVEINGRDAGLFSITQAAGQSIHSGTASTTTGVSGSITSLVPYTSLRLRCVVDDTDWELVAYNGGYVIA